ncbi:CopD family protein [Olivibacter sitiensis]|uniref:CopD family protein n=1 Tax=Olivibacter sitiensis TaxID=376470 RepID=UPI000412C3F6|nr:CopD family protein [Olivibacter sitiensis]
MIYLYAKAIHIIFVVCWMSGIFYIVRLFIYHTEARKKSPEEYAILHKQFVMMESKLWWIITTPSMYFTVGAGLLMLHLVPGLLSSAWMQVKLVFVLGMLVYHFICQRILFRLREEKSKWSSIQLRIWNEVATILLFAIVFTVVLKSAVNWIYGLIGLVFFSMMIMVAVKIYKRYREGK